MFQLVWLSGAVATALGIALDMHRLRANRVCLRPAGWIIAAACIGPLAGVAYLIQRRAARDALIDAVWQLVGDSSHPANMRRERLIALERSGLLGAPIFRACLTTLDTETGDATSTHDGEPTHVTDGDVGQPE
ncbi:hypothetical protein [Paraburkholderia madseniana]|uniref:hypothetical protein n=1 Tax=Paraburkholderia madseniana TaxID=2599607 RepID=UPI00158421BD|nr:hypothetical protein [Paraburkholderia madseniana]